MPIDFSLNVNPLSLNSLTNLNMLGTLTQSTKNLTSVNSSSGLNNNLVSTSNQTSPPQNLFINLPLLPTNSTQPQVLPSDLSHLLVAYSH